MSIVFLQSVIISKNIRSINIFDIIIRRKQTVKKILPGQLWIQTLSSLQKAAGKYIIKGMVLICSTGLTEHGKWFISNQRVNQYKELSLKYFNDRF